ncbi:hypothetical protein GOP47_0018869 [Adiantum capillus-veneris]|uniref:Homeobox domain-containing protein n=1 Tax=Adiantum capillus-veneris TaxID=13818 RepID=A0A9D4UE76_ADICA|nr:hypothetical protein GOP47_0018869 [Adiantum capillus-veneris]
MEKLWKESKGCPSRRALRGLVKKLSKFPERAGNAIHVKQVQNWFTKKRYTLKKQGVDITGKKGQICTEKKKKKAVPKTLAVSDEKNDVKLQFEAKSSRDSAWYDVKLFLAHRMIENGDPEVRVRFDGYGAADDEWVNMRTSVRERSLPCEESDCVFVLPGDLTLCFKVVF